MMFDATGHGVFPHEDDLPWDRRAFETSLFLGQPNYKTLRIDGELLRVYSAPVRRSGTVMGVVQAAQPLGPQQQLLQSVVDTLLILIPIAALLAAAGGLFLTHRAMRPVREVTAAAAELGAKDLSLRLTVRGDDEFAELARTFNGMMARLELTFGEVASGNRALAKAYRRLEEAYNQQRRFTGDASHELRTPLTRIKGSTSLALYGPHDADLYRKALVVADEAADAMSRLVQDLLLLARSDSGQLPIRRSSVDLHEVLREAMKGVGAEPGPAVVIDLPRNLPSIHGDVKHLARLFLNLIHNALRHTPAEGEIRITAFAKDDAVTVNVSDTGEGIPMEHLPHVTERFYRADASRSGGKGGTGLGLAICESIIHAHGGTLFLDSILGRGTTVTVTIPCARASEPAPTALHAGV
jgi:signal transduction histidine kinase